LLDLHREEAIPNNESPYDGPVSLCSVESWVIHVPRTAMTMLSSLTSREGMAAVFTRRDKERRIQNAFYEYMRWKKGKEYWEYKKTRRKQPGDAVDCKYQAS
jgi:hypothetical protein